MNYKVIDNDSDFIVCDTRSEREAFVAILNYLIESERLGMDDPILLPMDDSNKKTYWLIKTATRSFQTIAPAIPEN